MEDSLPSLASVCGSSTLSNFCAAGHDGATELNWR